MGGGGNSEADSPTTITAVCSFGDMATKPPGDRTRRLKFATPPSPESSPTPPLRRVASAPSSLSKLANSPQSMRHRHYVDPHALNLKESLQVARNLGLAGLAVGCVMFLVCNANAVADAFASRPFGCLPSAFPLFRDDSLAPIVVDAKENYSGSVPGVSADDDAQAGSALVAVCLVAVFALGAAGVAHLKMRASRPQLPSLPRHVRLAAVNAAK